MQITTNELRRMTNQEGLILQGCGGDMQEWVDGINELLTQEGILLEGTEGNNGKLSEHFTEYSKKKVWWRCKAGHSWLSTIYNCTLGNGYPYCSGRNVIAGYKDFFTMRPDLAGEWD